MRKTALLWGGLVLLGACGESQVPTDDMGTTAGIQAASGKEKDLRTLRTVTEPFRDFAQATASGYSTEITPCMTDPTLGGMGFHYGNVGLIDGTAAVDAPELLLYEPQASGRYKLVAVEYIIPYTFAPKDGPAPVLFGETFSQNDTFQLWGLHVWLWKNNPSGLFAPWNPRVSCSATSNAMQMQH